MSATTLHAVRPRGRAFRAAVLATVAGIALAGCAATEPVASHRATGSAAGAPAPPGDSAPAAAGAPQTPAATPAGGGNASSSVAAGAAPVPLGAADTLTPEDLAEIDRLLAGMDSHLSDADDDAATPEGDLG